MASSLLATARNSFHSCVVHPFGMSFVGPTIPVLSSPHEMIDEGLDPSPTNGILHRVHIVRRSKTYPDQSEGWHGLSCFSSNGVLCGMGHKYMKIYISKSRLEFRAVHIMKTE